ncbi:PREDICTED: ras GTPase-activating protein-binding protein 2 isoform X1 [Polistes dominula]|uniref:Ras GTPase-activating protein-binding protein 2 isoform X1 n=1 Tax=Polistes dominula TaxID=743375 RepID=A0ABM1IN56_POLDO|nr:PREDICTED: ras GTPase-activating protein-binding protein 2 isoform X1 [Polistes dominula]XP_015181643.1 PREDICTED: ras GTPase-activating protein-binding protein 2 isoform X1 [Polistes dominula]
MVMEASPSPQSVGREFVRQYYTLLNQAPAHLHRFYNQHSSFVHGGLDSNRESTPAVGQKQIHQKIQQLNFRDCHAKISQVDSQLTLENGVVVQVSGELSNAGQPMRRFTQTFVLAIQAPKKYYVHNDIFRYQDMIFPDEEETDVSGMEGGINETGERDAEEGGPSEPDEDEHQNQGQPLTGTAPAAEPQTQATLISTQQPQLQQQQIYYAQPPQPLVHPVMQQVLNGTVHEETTLINQQPQPQPQQQPPPPPPVQQQQQQQPQQQPPHQYIAEPTAQIQFAQETETDTAAEKPTSTEEEPQAQPAETQEQTEAETTYSATTQESEPERQVSPNTTNISSSGPKTYANLVKSFPSSNSTPSPQVPKISMSPVSSHNNRKPPMTNLRLDDRSQLHPTGSAATLSGMNVNASQQQTHRNNSNQQPQQPQHQQQRASRGGLVQRGNGERRGGTRPCQYSDAHQLFLGNLPHNASEHDLRQLFERYGKVADLRVHSKSSDRCKGPLGSNNNTKVPNYGFITFEDQLVVTKVLNSLPICYPDEHGQKLNVEEKKTKPRMSMDGSGGRLNSGDGNMRPMGQQQQQQRGPGRGGPGVMRGGQHGARGGRGGFPRGGDGGRGGGAMRQPGNPNNASYQNRR